MAALRDRGRSWILGQLALALAFNERVGMKEKGLGRREGKGKEREGEWAAVWQRTLSIIPVELSHYFLFFARCLAFILRWVAWKGMAY